MSHQAGKSVGHVLTRAARLHRVRLGQSLAEIGLFPGQDHLIEALVENDEMVVGALARTLNVKAPTVSKALSRLEAQGIVVRRGLETDARLTLVGLTDLGRERAARLASLWDIVEEDMLAEIDGKDRKRLRKLLRKAVRNLSASEGGSAEAADDEDDS
jgi:DNA-binding MarR family transcriptional regulator